LKVVAAADCRQLVEVAAPSQRIAERSQRNLRDAVTVNNDKALCRPLTSYEKLRDYIGISKALGRSIVQQSDPGR
jgi:hypothetical protein